MKELECRLECGHKIVWGESPETPGAALPRVGQIVWCPECESDEEIMLIEPEQVVTYSEDLPLMRCQERKLHVFYDCASGTWGWCISECEDGRYAETDNVTGFEAENNALDAGRAWDEDQIRDKCDKAYEIMAEWDREAGVQNPDRDFDQDVPSLLTDPSSYWDWLWRLAHGDVRAIVEGRTAWDLPLFV